MSFAPTPDPDDAIIAEKKRALLVGDNEAFIHHASKTLNKNEEILQKLKDEQAELKRTLLTQQKEGPPPVRTRAIYTRSSSVPRAATVGPTMGGPTPLPLAPGSPLPPEEEAPADGSSPLPAKSCTPGAAAAMAADAAAMARRVSDLRRAADGLRHEILAKQDEAARMRDRLHDLEVQTPPAQGDPDTPEKKVRACQSCTRAFQTLHGVPFVAYPVQFDIHGRALSTMGIRIIVDAIRELENRLDKTIIRYNEAQSIQKGYLATLGALKNMHATFDNRMASFQATLRAKERDHEELLAMARAAQQAADLAKARHARMGGQLHQLRDACAQEEAEWTNTLAARRAAWQHAENAPKPTMAPIKPQAGGLVSDVFLLTEVPQTERSMEPDSNTQTTQKLVTAEEAFRRIKEATGDDDVNRVIQKFITQERDHLEAEHNLALAKEALERATADLAEEQRLKTLGDQQAAMDIGNKRLEEEMQAKVAVEQLVSDVKEGVKLLAGKVQLPDPERRFEHPLNLGDIEPAPDTLFLGPSSPMCTVLPMHPPNLGDIEPAPDTLFLAIWERLEFLQREAETAPALAPEVREEAESARDAQDARRREEERLLENQKSKAGDRPNEPKSRAQLKQEAEELMFRHSQQGKNLVSGNAGDFERLFAGTCPSDQSDITWAKSNTLGGMGIMRKECTESSVVVSPFFCKKAIKSRQPISPNVLQAKSLSNINMKTIKTHRSQHATEIGHALPFSGCSRLDSLPSDILFLVVENSVSWLETWIKLLALNHSLRCRLHTDVRALVFDWKGDESDICEEKASITPSTLVALIGPCKNLQEIDLNFSSLRLTRCGAAESIYGPWVDAAFRNHDSLRRLSLDTAGFSVGAICRIISLLPGLADLTLRDFDLPEADENAIIAHIGATCRNLRSLSLGLHGDYCVTPSALVYTPLLPACGGLTDLDLASKGAGIAEVVHAPAALEFLDAPPTALPDVAAARALNLGALTRLDLSNAPLVAAGILAGLARPELCQLDSLGLEFAFAQTRDRDDAAMRSDGASLRTILRSNAHTLTDVYLSGRPPLPTDALLDALAEMPQLDNVRLRNPGWESLPPGLGLLLGRLEVFTLEMAVDPRLNEEWEDHPDGDGCAHPCRADRWDIVSDRLRMLYVSSTSSVLHVGQISVTCPRLHSLTLQAATEAVSLSCPRLQDLALPSACRLEVRSPMPELNFVMSASREEVPEWLPAVASAPRLTRLGEVGLTPALAEQLLSATNPQPLNEVGVSILQATGSGPLALHLTATIRELVLDIPAHIPEFVLHAPGLISLDLGYRSGCARVSLGCPAIRSLTIRREFRRGDDGASFDPPSIVWQGSAPPPLTSLAVNDSRSWEQGLLLPTLKSLSWDLPYGGAEQPGLAFLGDVCCPVLESLNMHLGSTPLALFQSSTLRELMIDGMSRRSKVVLRCPALEILRYDDLEHSNLHKEVEMPYLIRERQPERARYDLSDDDESSPRACPRSTHHSHDDDDDDDDEDGIDEDEDDNDCRKSPGSCRIMRSLCLFASVILLFFSGVNATVPVTSEKSSRLSTDLLLIVLLTSILSFLIPKGKKLYDTMKLGLYIKQQCVIIEAHMREYFEKVMTELMTIKQ
ncbi:putative neurofilament triplet l [Paratrimastix pyriformis]|uniref:Neurofilament triplet l n=1 Tax=Paratrimastix pyriformis TaxID=342808 RepID=A0ABQ8UR48_9EUKA|nr:putative neurofilament triplet l [Paratrimastix pyriformis]